MIPAVKILALIAITYLSFTLVFSILKPISKRRRKKTRNFLKITKNQAFAEKLYYFRDIVLRRFAKKVFIGDLKREEYRILISRLDLKITPEELRAQQVLLSLGAVMISMAVLQISRPFGYLCLLGPVLGWMYPIDELERKVELRNKNIMQDFPSFYSMLYYQYSRSVDIYLADVVRDFLPNANPDMQEELGVLLDNIEYGEEFALKQLKKRVPLRHVIKFCDIMQTRLNGYDNVSQMAYLKNELHELRIQTLEEELKSRQDKNVRTQFSLVAVLGAFILIYFYFQFMEAFKMFSF